MSTAAAEPAAAPHHVGRNPWLWGLARAASCHAGLAPAVLGARMLPIAVLQTRPTAAAGHRTLASGLDCEGPSRLPVIPCVQCAGEGTALLVVRV